MIFILFIVVAIGKSIEDLQKEKENKTFYERVIDFIKEIFLFIGLLLLLVVICIGVLCEFIINVIVYVFKKIKNLLKNVLIRFSLW